MSWLLDSVTSAISSVADTVKTGVVGTGEKVPFSCQVPFKKMSSNLEGADVYSELFRSECQALRESPKWVKHDFVDPEGGDMKLWTQDQIGTYHFVKASFTIKNTSTRYVFDKLTSGQKSVRADFSADLELLSIFAQKDKNSLLRIAYTAPAGSAGRDFIFLISEVQTGNTLETWGCSVDVSAYPEDFDGYVRGACLYHWEATQEGDDVKCTYTGCFDPRGWAPPFIIGYFKTSATGEFCKLRKLCEGKK